MLNEKLLEVLSHPADGEVAIVTQGIDGPHVVNTWNSYVSITPDGRMLIPAGRMNKTEKILKGTIRLNLLLEGGKFRD